MPTSSPGDLVLSFKLILLLFVLGCGVKSDPTPPLDSTYPGYDTKFIKKPTPTPPATNE